MVTPYGRDGPSSRVRVFEWLDRDATDARVSSYVSHRNAGPRHLLGHPLAVLAAERRLRRFAAATGEPLLLHREASPLSRGGLERRLLTRPALTVYDFDDALQWDRGDGGLYRRWAPKAPKALLAVTRADRVIAGNAVLADWASGHNPDVRVIPSCVDPSAYVRKVDYALADPPRLGWIGSSDNEVYLRLVAEPLLELHRQTGARLTLLGTERRSLGALERVIDRVRWSERGAHALLARLDVGIAPVPDEPYTRGKSGYKLLQYAAAGVPFAATPVGVNREILSRLRMPAPEQPSDWLDALLDMLGRAASERQAAGAAARALVEAEYSYGAWLTRWREAVGIDAPPAG